MIICIAIFGTSLFYAVLSDLRTQLVRDIAWWAALAACLGMIALRVAGHGLLAIDWTGTGLFLLVQEGIMGRCYGRADCHGFCVSALCLAGFGLGLREDVLMMAIAFVLLTAVQALKRNIGRDRKLKRPVAFLPYLAAGLLGVPIVNMLQIPVLHI